MPEEKYILKDVLFNKQTVSVLVNALANVYPTLEPNDFLTDALKAFPDLELKERMSYLRVLIEKYISEDYINTLQILLRSLNYVEDSHESFVFGAYQDYIMINGCTEEYLNISLDYMGKFTQYFSAEFAIRPFITHYPEATYQALEVWAKSDNVHKRRLVSEGIRPKLPWGKSIDFDYKKASELLEYLYHDSERYVTRSVANHLNDISKIDPDFVLEILKRWASTNKQNESEMQYIINHSLRTSIKKSHRGTLEFLGYPTNPNISIETFSIQETNLKLGDSLIFSFEIIAHEKVSLMIDYNINYPMAREKRSDKVFKIKKISLDQGESLTIEKKHLFKSMTTKKLYSGEYTLNLQINGHSYEKLVFNLTV